TVGSGERVDATLHVARRDQLRSWGNEDVGDRERAVGRDLDALDLQLAERLVDGRQSGRAADHDLELAVVVEIAELDLPGAGDLDAHGVVEAPLVAAKDPHGGAARLVAVAIAGRRCPAGCDQIELTIAVEIADRGIERIAPNRQRTTRALESAAAVAR